MLNAAVAAKVRGRPRASVVPSGPLANLPVSALYVNLPVADLARSVAFYARLGFAFNESYSDDRAACMIVSERAMVMLLARPFFETFTPLPVADATLATGSILAVECASAADVDAIMQAALRQGAAEPRAPQTSEALYSRAFTDPDGHLWELVFLDPDFRPDPEERTR